MSEHYSQASAPHRQVPRDKSLGGFSRSRGQSGMYNLGLKAELYCLFLNFWSFL